MNGATELRFFPRCSVGRGILLLLAVLSGANIYAADPVGRQGAFLGNTTARPSEIGSAIDFPSAYAFRYQENGEYTVNFLFYIPSYLRKHFKSESYRLLPYFSASGWQGKKSTFTVFVRNQTASSLQISQQELQDTLKFTSTDTLYLGLANSWWGNRFSAGQRLAVERTSLETNLLTRHRAVADNFFAQAASANIYQLLWAVSLSFRTSSQLFTLALRAPSLLNHVSLKEVSLAHNSKVLITKNRRQFRAPAGVSLGYFYDGVAATTMPLALTAEVHYHGTGKINAAATKAYWQYATGLKVKFYRYYLLLGGNYTTRSSPEYPANYGLSMGLQWRRSQGQPILGPYYKRYAYAHHIHEIGLLFSIGQW